MGSLDQVVEGEGVTAVHFAESLPARLDWDVSKCLYVGTSLGSVLTIVIVVPDQEERLVKCVCVSLSVSLSGWVKFNVRLTLVKFSRG